MIFDNNNIYCLIGGNIIKSSDFGLTWKYIGANRYLCRIFKDNIYNLNLISDPKNSNIFFTKYDFPTNSFIRLNQDGFTRAAPMQYLIDYHFINEDTIIAVGNNKLIYLSFDGGKNWELKSYFNKYYCTYWLNSKTGFAGGDVGQIFKTINGGTTWLPQLFSDPLIFNFGTISKLYFNKTGVGIGFNYQIGYTQNNILITSDSGLTYTQNNLAQLHQIIQGSSFLIFDLDTNFYIFNSERKMRDQRDWTTQIYLLDSSMIINNISSLDSITFVDVNQLDKLGNFLAIAIDRKKPYDSLIQDINELADTTKNFITYSSNFCKAWQNDFSFQISGAIRNSIKIDNNLIAFCCHQKWVPIDSMGFYIQYFYKLIKIDLANKTVIDLYQPRSNKNNSAFYYFNNKFYINNDSLLLSNNDILNYPNKWEEFKFSDIFYAKNNVWCDNETAYISVVQKNYQTKNILKLTVKKSSDFIDNTETPTPSYFYSFPPYPIPATNQISAKIYWDLRYDIDKADFSVYNIYGMKIDDKSHFALNKEKSYSGTLTWNCATAPDGVYMLVIKHGDATRAIPVIIER